MNKFRKDTTKAPMMVVMGDRCNVLCVRTLTVTL